MAKRVRGAIFVAAMVCGGFNTASAGGFNLFIGGAGPVYGPPVVYAPPPVVYAPPPVVYGPPPAYYGVGFYGGPPIHHHGYYGGGWGGYHHGHHGHW